MSRRPRQVRFAAHMKAEGRCEDHGILLPCTQCRNNKKRSSARYYERHREQVQARMRAYRQKRKDAALEQPQRN